MNIFKSQNVHPKYIIYWNQYFNFLQQPWLTIADLQVVLRGEELNCFQTFHESRNPPSSELQKFSTSLFETQGTVRGVKGVYITIGRELDIKLEILLTILRSDFIHRLA